MESNKYIPVFEENLAYNEDVSVRTNVAVNKQNRKSNLDKWCCHNV